MVENTETVTLGLHRCPSCTSTKVTEQMETDAIEYGVGKTVPIIVTRPVLHCSACKESWTDFRGEEAVDTVVNNYREVFEKPLRTKLEKADARIRELEHKL